MSTTSSPLSDTTIIVMFYPWNDECTSKVGSAPDSDDDKVEEYTYSDDEKLEECAYMNDEKLEEFTYSESDECDDQKEEDLPKEKTKKHYVDMYMEKRTKGISDVKLFIKSYYPDDTGNIQWKVFVREYQAWCKYTNKVKMDCRVDLREYLKSIGYNFIFRKARGYYRSKVLYIHWSRKWCE